MPGPRAVQNLQIPHPWDWQGGQMPRSSPGEGGGLGAGGIDWCIKQLFFSISVNSGFRNIYLATSWLGKYFATIPSIEKNNC